MNRPSFRVNSVKNYDSFVISRESPSNLSYHNEKMQNFVPINQKFLPKEKTNLNLDLSHRETGPGFWIFESLLQREYLPNWRGKLKRAEKFITEEVEEEEREGDGGGRQPRQVGMSEPRVKGKKGKRKGKGVMRREKEFYFKNI